MELTQANIERHAPLLAAVGLLTPDMTSFRLWEMFYAVVEDAELSKRLQDERAKYLPEYWRAPDALEIVEAMTETEREELRERIRTARPRWF